MSIGMKESSTYILCSGVYGRGNFVEGDFMSKEFYHLFEILTSCDFMMTSGLLGCMSPKYCIVVVGQIHGDQEGYLDRAYDCGEGCIPD